MIGSKAATPSPDENAVRRLRRAELTSGVGALILGVGLGSLMSDYLASAAVVILTIGTAMHALGMLDKHRMERRGRAASVWWADLLYWVCWSTLVVISIYLLIRVFVP